MPNIVFDIGNVLIAWDERAAFRGDFPDDAKIDQFLAKVGFYEWNLEQDRGRLRTDAVAAVSAMRPEYAALLNNYFDRFPDTIQNKINGTWTILDDLKAKGHRIFGLTNWGTETWPMAIQAHPQLSDVFEDVVVSGHEKLIKPDRRIYEELTSRNKLLPEECVFIDDSPKNVEGAIAAGWKGLHFTGSDVLRKSLQDWELL